MNPFSIVIGASIVVILSYFFNIIAKKKNIPSVILLIVLGIGIQEGLSYFGYIIGDSLRLPLEILGQVGLILIVLEAALDLKLTKEKMPIIGTSFVVALVALLLTSLGVAAVLYYFIFTDPFQSLLYAIPLSIMSSAIIIPSVFNLKEDNKEFMIYESTFSDILGIMFFFMLQSNMGKTAGEAATSVAFNITLTLVLSVLISFALIYIFTKLETQVKLFLILAVLILIYSVGKVFHFSSLVLILIFGMMLNNPKLFLKNKLRSILTHEKVEALIPSFHTLSLETAFIVRTFFFVIFGMTIVLSSLYNINVVIYSICIVAVLYLTRWIVLKLFLPKKISPMLYIAPRGLITILLFFSIPNEFVNENFDQGILLFAILLTSFIMMISLIRRGKKGLPVLDTEKIADSNSLDQN